MKLEQQLKPLDPKTWPELIWIVFKALGPSAVAILSVICLFGWVVWCTLPRWVESNMAVQQSLTKNLEQQTLNITAQTENIKAQTDAVKEVQIAVTGMSDATKARDESWKEFSVQVSKEHNAQMESQEAIVETLSVIQDVIVNREVVVVKPE